MRIMLLVPVIAGALMSTQGEAQSAPPQFAQCMVCHSAKKGASPSLGPNLFGVGGTKAGAMAGYRFSPAMAKSQIVWNRQNIIKFITNPAATVPGTKMTYMGQRDPRVAAAIADYLITLK
ncbi:hypothetical protein BH09PSE4_BH09PSE4_08690 [soil metagenome]